MVCFLLNYLYKKRRMKLSNKLIIGLTLVAAAGVVVYFSKSASKGSKTRRMLNQIADEGYETAQDVLFPNKNIQDKNLHFGPVIPR